MSNGTTETTEVTIHPSGSTQTTIQYKGTNVCTTSCVQKTSPTHSFDLEHPSENRTQNQFNGSSLRHHRFSPDLLRTSAPNISSSDFTIDTGLKINISDYELTNGSSIGNITEGYNDYYVDYVYDYSTADESLPLEEILPVSFVYAVTLLVGVVGNLLVIVAVARDRRLRSITNIFLTSLACADLALLCFCVPVKCVAFFSFSWTFGFLLCKSVHYFQIVAMVCSVMTLTVMSIERNIAILSPLRSKRICTRSRARIVVILLWSASVVLALPILAGQKHKLVGELRKAYWCTKEWDQPVYGILFESYMLVLLFLVPVGVMVVSYTTICLELSRGTKFRRQATNVPSRTTYRGYANRRARFCMRRVRQASAESCREIGPGERNHERMEQEKIKVIRMLIVVVVLFAVCWGPILINNLLVALRVLEHLHIGHLKPLRQAMFLLSYLNSSLNPLVYGFMSRHFRRGFREAVCVCCSANDGRRLYRGRDGASIRWHYASESSASTRQTVTIQLSPVIERPAVVYEEIGGASLGSKRVGHKIWARGDKTALRLQDNKDYT